MAKSSKRLEFPTTTWSLVERAARHDEQSDTLALNELLTRYYPALQAHLVHAWQLSGHEAEDLVQSFLADKVLAGKLLVYADRNRGRFRRFIAKALEYFVISRLRKESAKRRYPGQDAVITLDEYLAREVPVENPSVRSVYDLVWTQRTVEETLRRVEEECRRTGREHFWQVFESRAIKPFLGDEKAEPYARMIKRLGFKSPIQASNAFLTMKRIFNRTFREVVQEYVKSESMVEDEIAEVRGMLDRLGVKRRPPVKDG